MDRSAAWDATLRIVFGLFIVGVGNAIGGFLASLTGIAGLALYLLMAVPTFVYGMFYVVIGAGMVVEAATESALSKANLTVEVADGEANGRDDSDGDRGDDADPSARD
ncbi:hypothetical protein [Haloferax sulfurifontis]|uniref:Uncharacterized protein n=2 Tax=Haloferax sulfurifontis TaxID=255616 RepID=M0HXR3_9EURY|nr:hypothetical protein [Haloferax sulfurifontis]ELZ89291.1 hypothetical protein C441_17409 [Haloferax sulfurifontis ATCC BAA-897]GGC70115.1 hypothetical protein GCM10007209_35100 [Haloferax sulfurifontis]